MYVYLNNRNPIQRRLGSRSFSLPRPLHTTNDLIKMGYELDKTVCITSACIVFEWLFHTLITLNTPHLLMFLHILISTLGYFSVVNYYTNVILAFIFLKVLACTYTLVYLFYFTIPQYKIVLLLFPFFMNIGIITQALWIFKTVCTIENHPDFT